MSHWFWAKEMARECQRVADAQHEQRKAWEQKFLRKDAAENFVADPTAPAAPEFKPIRPCTRWGVEETLLVNIAWDCFTNDEIVTYFRQWVKATRPKEIPAPSNRGHKPGDWRANLTRLSAMRLLARFTTREILGSRRIMPVAECQPIHDTKQFTSAKWGDSTKWHDARREAGQLFRKLFPFLPADEKPISWERPAPGK